MRRINLGNREFYKTFLGLAVPIALQNLVASSLNLVDTVMVGRLGETQISAVGAANQVFFILNLTLFGLCSGSAIFTAQFWGKKDIPNVRRVLGIGLVIGVSAAMLFTVAAALLPERIIGIFSRDPGVIKSGGRYLGIIAFSYVPMAISFFYASTLRSTGQVKLPMRVSVMALAINTLLNYLLIFGILGLPQMGVAGSALATVIARYVECAVLLHATYRNHLPAAAHFREMADVSAAFVRKFIRTITPVVLNEGFWAIGVSICSMVYFRMGTGVSAAMNMVSTVDRLAFVAFVGMGNACAVMVGNSIGAGEEEKAYEHARIFSVIGPAGGVFMGLVLIAVSPAVLSLYNVSADVYSSAVHILRFIGLIIPLRIFNMITIVGILRSGGDTKFSLIMDAMGTWVIAVPMALLGGLVLKFPIEIVYPMVCLEEVFKFTLGIRRFLSRKWINNLVERSSLDSECV